MLLRPFNFNSAWIDRYCRRISYLRNEISILLDSRYIGVAGLFFLFGLPARPQAEKYGNWSMADNSAGSRDAGLYTDVKRISLEKE